MEDFFSFRRMISPILIQGGYILTSVVFALFALFFEDGPFILKLLVLIVGLVFIRLLFETMILFFRMNETLTDIRDSLVRMPAAPALGYPAAGHAASRPVTNGYAAHAPAAAAPQRPAFAQQVAAVPRGTAPARPATSAPGSALDDVSLMWWDAGTESVIRHVETGAGLQAQAVVDQVTGPKLVTFEPVAPPAGEPERQQATQPLADRLRNAGWGRLPERPGDEGPRFVKR